MNKKRCGKPTTTINDVQHLQPVFSYLAVGTTCEYVDPFVYIPFTTIGETSDSLFNKLIELYDDSEASHPHGDSQGFAL